MEKIVIAPQYRLRLTQRLAVIAYALAHGLKGASRPFGLDRKTVRTWVRRWRAGGGYPAAAAWSGWGGAGPGGLGPAPVQGGRSASPSRTPGS